VIITLPAGDGLMVTWLDRLARSTRDFLIRWGRPAENRSPTWPQLQLHLCTADFPLPGLVAPVSVVPSAVPLPVPALGVIPDE
jgi:hypothetical protein